MSTHQKTYRFRLQPTPDQETMLIRFAGARRWVWNWALRRKQSWYQETGQNLSFNDLCQELTILKQNPATAWLAEIVSQLLQQALRDLTEAFKHFFARRAKYPRFKSKKHDETRFRIPQRVTMVGEHIIVPKIGAIKLRLHRPIEGKTKSATFKRELSGHWFVALVVTFNLPDDPPPTPDSGTTIGVDLGLKEFAVLSTGERIPAPKYYRAAERKIKRKQRSLSRKQRGGYNRARARREIIRLYRKVNNHRNDFLPKSIYDAGWGSFRRMLSYKAAWRQKNLIVISRWYPSSRVCHVCGTINDELTLAERIWMCACGAVHDRDLNAAINIRRQGLHLLAVGHTER